MALNIIWIAFFFIAFLTCLIKFIFLGDVEVFPSVVNSTFSNAKLAFEISLWLTGTLALWLGLLRVGEKGGMIRILAKLVNPFFSRIFPEIPKNHPVMGSIVMNFAANMMGLDNAATPLGLEAMKGMQKLNPNKSVASNSQIMFLVLNTSGLTLLPIPVIMYRVQFNSINPSEVFVPILLATLLASIGGLIVVAIYQKINLLNGVILSYLGGISVVVFGTLWLFSELTPEQAQTYASVASNLILMTVITCILALSVVNKVNAYDAFIEGAKEGFQVAINIIPYLVGILVGIGVFRASGAMDYLIDSIRWCAALVNLDGEYIEALPVAFMKPLSGSGARGMMIEAINTFGVDSFVGKLAATMQGTTDTTLYIIAVYFGAVKIKNTRYAITAGLLADFIGIVSAIFIAYMFYA